MNAALTGNTALVNELAAQGVDTTTTRKGLNALHVAARNAHFEASGNDEVNVCRH